MKVSNELIDKIKQFEGYRSKAYRCSAGVLTCGYGHTKGVTARTTCNKTKALAWLKSDLEPIENFLSAIPEVCKSQGRFDACADFCFNLGMGAFRGSTLFKLIQRKASVDSPRIILLCLHLTFRKLLPFLHSSVVPTPSYSSHTEILG